MIPDNVYAVSVHTVEIPKKHNEIVSVKTVLGPLAQADVPSLRCVGLNYAKHGELPNPL